MSVSLPITIPAPAVARGPSLWELGSQLEGENRWIQQLADRLLGGDESDEQQAVADLEEALAAEEGQREALQRKADATCWVIERLRAEADYHQLQGRRFSALSRSEASRADALERTLLLVLTRLEPGARSFQLKDHRITSRLSDAVEVHSSEALPPELLTVTSSTSPDKASIKQRIKAAIAAAIAGLAGEEASRVALEVGATAVPGARLIQRRSWSIR